MKKTIMMSVAMMMFTCQLLAQEFTTPGEGKAYSFQALSAISESGVTFSDGAFIVNGLVTIAPEDEFVIDPGVTVSFTNEGELVIKGKADLRATTPTRLCASGETSTSLGLNVQSEELVEVSNLTFEQVGLRGGVKAGINVSDCTFLKHNGSASSALFLGGDGASFKVVNCTFENCQKAAIGGAANYLCPLIVEKVSGVTNSVAFLVSITWTVYPRLRSLDTSSALLYAAIPPVTPKTTVLESITDYSSSVFVGLS